MKKTIGLKKMASLVAVAGLATVSLTACSGDSDSGSADPKPADAGGDKKPAGETVEIKYMHRLPDGEGMVHVAEIVDRWNAEHPEIQVKSEKFDGQAQEMIKKLENDVKANSAPCLAQLGYAEVPEMFTKGLTADVTAEAEKYKDNFSGAYAGMKVGDVVVGLPQDTGPLVYFYDEAEFEALGLKVPTNLEELKTEAKKAAEQGKYILDFEPDEAQNWLSGQAAAAGDSWYSATSDNKWKVEAAGKGSKIVADFWNEILKDGAALTLNRWDKAYDKAMIDKQLIGNIGAAWEAGFMLDKVVPEGEEGTWKVALLPDFGGGKLTGPDGGSGVAVLKGCEHPAEAMAFNDWFNRQTKDLATQGLVVAAKGDVVTPEKVKRQFGGQDVYAELAKANETLSDKFGYMPGFSAVGEKMKEVASKIVADKGDIMGIFEAAQEASVKTLKEQNLPVAE